MHSHKSGAVLTKRELIEAAATYPLSEIQISKSGDTIPIS